FFSSRRRHTRFSRDWSSDVCSSDLPTSSWSAGRVVAVVAGSVAVLLGLLAVVGGITLLTWQASQREDGYATTPTWEVDTPRIRRDPKSVVEGTRGAMSGGRGSKRRQ